MTKPKLHTHAAVLIDRSGSMNEGGKRDAAISAYNEWLADQRTNKADRLTLTVTLFDTETVILDHEVKPNKATPLSNINYVPGGNTSLNDAIMDTLKAAEQVDADRYLVVILTDGQENSSRRHTKRDVLQRVENLQSLGNWTFVYLSASPDAFADAAAYGIAMANTVVFANTAVGTRAVGMHTNAATRAYRRAGGQSVGNWSQLGDEPVPDPKTKAKRK